MIATSGYLVRIHTPPSQRAAYMYLFLLSLSAFSLSLERKIGSSPIVWLAIQMAILSGLNQPITDRRFFSKNTRR